MYKMLDQNNRFWVGVGYANEILVFDQEAQGENISKVFLWSVKFQKMYSSSAAKTRKEVKCLKDVDMCSLAIAAYLNQGDNKELIARIALLQQEELSVKRKIKNDEIARLHKLAFHPESDSLHNFFNAAGIEGDCFPPNNGLLRNARSNRPYKPEATASAFSQWVYDLYHKHVPYSESHDADEYVTLEQAFNLELGIFSEKSIEELKLWVNKSYPGSLSRNWRVVFVDNKEPSVKAFEASRLRVNGQPLRCKPDVVIENKLTGDVIILERKSTRVPIEKIPPLGWANLKLQLWCYSWIDQWRDAPNVYLIGQLWRVEVTSIYKLRFPTFTLLPVYPRWTRSDKKFQTECSTLFEIYGGKIFG